MTIELDSPSSHPFLISHPRSNYRLTVVYRLSQAAQRDVWLAACKNNQVTPDGSSYEACQVQTVLLQGEAVDSTTWESALELVWISPWGAPFIFVGGRDAFVYDKPMWRAGDKSVPTGWSNEQNIRAEVSVWGAPKLTHGTPLEIEDLEMSAAELIEMEESRLSRLEEAKQMAIQRIGTRVDGPEPKWTRRSAPRSSGLVAPPSNDA